MALFTPHSISLRSATFSREGRRTSALPSSLAEEGVEPKGETDEGEKGRQLKF
ncbi:hypothetical protein [Mesorhizobium sp. SP-1A]|uniref:hypothetical protein n=1 Tax=Mesorhizobium sp. SP-1A TaxID=3077840 RepID=UPI0028F70062|nr:hypothetical protein [Mesorhizobium sp. SP-1A]